MAIFMPSIAYGSWRCESCGCRKLSAASEVVTPRCTNNRAIVAGSAASAASRDTTASSQSRQCHCIFERGEGGFTKGDVIRVRRRREGLLGRSEGGRSRQPYRAVVDTAQTTQ